MESDHHGSGVLQPISTQKLSWQSPARMAGRNCYIQICLLPRTDVPEHCAILEIYALTISMDEDALDCPCAGLGSFPSLLFTHNEIENEAILPAGEVHHSGGDLLPVSGVSQDRALQDPEELQPGDHQQDPDYAGVSSADLQSWRAQIAKFHRAAGHPIARNLARMLQDAQIERWKIKEALQYRCPVCEEHKPGGKSSRQVAPMSIRPLPQPWEHLGIDITEWEVPGIDLKVKFMVMMDMATHYRVTETLAT